MENILISQELNVKLADFGLSVNFRESEENEFNKSFYCAHTLCGTPAYVAPEVLDPDNDHGYDAFKADVWSLLVSKLFYTSRQTDFINLNNILENNL